MSEEEAGDCEVIDLSAYESPEGWTLGWSACLRCGYTAMHVRPVAQPTSGMECGECGHIGQIGVWNRHGLALDTYSTDDHQETRDDGSSDE